MAVKEIKGKKWPHYTFSSIVLISLLILFIFIDDIIRVFSQFPFIKGFIVTFIAIVIEAFPFLLIGCIVSAVLEVYVSEKTITGLIPKNRFLGVIITSLLGIIFPVCECATVPIVRRLRKKGMPLYIAITFMVAAPIINPTVTLSTAYAFWDRPFMILLRIACGFTGAVTIGLVLSFLESKNMFKNVMRKEHKKEKGVCEHDVENRVDSKDKASQKKGILKQLPALFTHAGIDLYDTGRFFILGAFLASLLRSIIPGNILAAVGHHRILSLVVMGIFAFALSVCSEADAFIARKFISQFTPGSLVVFLILGPMIDIKNTLMLLGTFKGKFILILGIIIFIVCILLGIIVNVTPIGRLL